MAGFGVAADYPELRQRYGIPSREDLIARATRDVPSDDDFAQSEPVPLSMWAPPAPPEPDTTTALGRLARTPGAAVERFSALSGTAIGSVAEAGTKALGATGIISPQTQASAMARLEDTINKFRNVDIVKDPGLGLDYITQGSGGGGYLGRALLAGVGTIVTSSPDYAAAAIGGIPGGVAYASTYAADLARQHAVNRTGDANASPTAEDYGYGFAIGLPSAALQMFGSNLVTGALGKGMFKGLAEKVTAGADKVLERYLGPATGAAMNRVRSAITTGGLEAITEFPQNQLDYLASTLGTDKFDVHEFWRQGIEGGVLAFLSGGIAGGVLPHGARETTSKKLPGAVSGLLGPDIEEAVGGGPPGFTPLPPLPPARPAPGGHPSGTAPIVGTPGPPGTTGELFPPGTALTPPVRALPPEPTYTPPVSSLSEVGTVVDPSQLQLGALSPAQTALPLGERETGVGARQDLMPTSLREPMAALPAATGTVSDPRQSSLLSSDVLAAMDAHNAQPEGAKPDQGEMFRRQQVEPAGPVPVRPQDLRGPAPAVHPLAETGTIVDPAQRSALNPLAGPGYPNAPAIDPGFLGRQAQARLRAGRGTQPAAPAAPAMVSAPVVGVSPAPAAPVGRPTPVLAGIDRLAPPVAPSAVFRPDATPAATVELPDQPSVPETPAAPLTLGAQARLRLKGARGTPVAPRPPRPARAAGRPATTQQPAAPVQSVAAPEQPQGPQIRIAANPVKRPSFPSVGNSLNTPARAGAVTSLRAVAHESNQPGAAEDVKDLRRRVELIGRNVGGVSLGDLEEAAGIERGGIKKQLDALEKSHRSTIEAGAPATAPVKGRKQEPPLKMAAAPGMRPTTVAGHVLHGRSSPLSHLNRIINDTKSEASRFLAPIAEMLLRGHLVDHVPIRYVDGLYDLRSAWGIYFPGEDRVEIEKDLGPGVHDMVLMHELVHAATVHGILANPQLHGELEQIRQFLEGAIGPDHPLAFLFRAMTARPEEIVTYALTHPEAHEVLSGIRYGKESLWTRIKAIIARALGLQTQDYSLLDRVMEISVQAMHEQAQARAMKAMNQGAPGTYAGAMQRESRRAGGFTTAVTNPRPHPLGTRVDEGQGHSALMAKLGREMPADLREGLGAGQKDLAWANYDHTRLPDGSIVLPDHNLSALSRKPPPVGADEVLRASPDAFKNLLSTDPAKRRAYSEGVFNRLRRMNDNPKERAQQAVSNIQSIPQLVQWYRKHFGNDSGPNPLVEWMKSFDARRRHEGDLRERANDIQQRHNDLPKEEQEKLAVVAQFATMKGVDPSRAEQPFATIDPKENPAVRSRQEKANRDWQRARAAYDTLSSEARQVLQDSRDFFKNSFAERRKLLLQQVLEPRGIDPGRITATTSLGEVMDMFRDSRKDPKKAPSRAERNVIRLIRGTYAEVPIYFPLRRTGRYYTAVEHKQTVDYAQPQDHLGDTERQDDPTIVGSKVLKAGTTEDPRTQVEYTHRDVAFHDTVQQGKDYLKQLFAENPSLKASNIENPTLRRAEQGGHGLPAHTLISHLVENLGQDTQAARDATDTVLALLPELSQWKARMRRHNIPGAKPEQFRAAMAREMKNLGRQEAVLKYSRELAGHMKDMRNLQREVNRTGDANRASKMNILLSQLEKLQLLERQLPSGPVSATINRLVGTFGFVSYLASPSFALVNATQVLTNTLPELGSKYGYGPAVKALHDASAAIHRKGLIARSAVSSLLGAKALARLVTDKVKPDEKLRNIEDTITENIRNSNVPYKDDIVKKLMPDLIARGRAGETQAQELLHTAREAGPLSKTLNDALEIAREMAQATETTNRVVSGIATYILERDRGADHETASQAAVDNIDLTQFAYDPEYRSSAFRQLWRPATQFKEYPLGTYNLLAQHFSNVFSRGKTPEERARGLKALAGTALAYSIMGGLMGPLWNEPTRIFVNSLFYLYNKINGTDVDPEDEMRKWLRDVSSELGGSPWVGEAVTGGLPRLAGIDLSSRISLSQLLFPSSVRGSEPADKVGNAIGSFMLGPTVYNTAANTWTALADPKVKNILAALPFIPKTIRDIYTAAQLHDQGMTDTSGDTLTEPMDAYQTMVQAMGFTPAQVARLREKRGAVYRLQHAENDRRDVLLQEYRTTPVDDRASVLARIKAFNDRRPVQPITGRTLVNSLKAKALRERQIRHVGGIALPNKQAPLVERATGVMPP